MAVTKIWCSISQLLPFLQISCNFMLGMFKKLDTNKEDTYVFIQEQGIQINVGN